MSRQRSNGRPAKPEVAELERGQRNQAAARFFRKGRFLGGIRPPPHLRILYQIRHDIRARAVARRQAA